MLLKLLSLGSPLRTSYDSIFTSNNFEDEVGNDEQKSMDEGKRKTTPCQSIH